MSGRAWAGLLSDEKEKVFSRSPRALKILKLTVTINKALLEMRI